MSWSLRCRCGSPQGGTAGQGARTGTVASRVHGSCRWDRVAPWKQCRMWSRRCWTVCRGSLKQAPLEASPNFSLQRCPSRLCLTSQLLGRPRARPSHRSAHQNTCCWRIAGVKLGARSAGLQHVCRAGGAGRLSNHRHALQASSGGFGHRQRQRSCAAGPRAADSICAGHAEDRPRAGAGLAGHACTWRHARICFIGGSQDGTQCGLLLTPNILHSLLIACSTPLALVVSLRRYWCSNTGAGRDHT